MCGISGRVNLFSQRPVDESAIREMCAWIAHRGPDDAGALVEGFAGFGHQRLSIIDLSPGGHQPMVSRSGRYWIVFNGEIYNYRALRAELESAGVMFRSSSDTEVLLAAFEAYGPVCLARLRGMFAFAIWDTETRQLTLARDRVGKKPLYYRTDRDGVAFASESKAFFGEKSFDARPNAQALSAYLSLQYVPAPLSAFEGVSVVPPAHYLVATEHGTSVHRYWKLQYEPKWPLDEGEAEEALLETLKEAVRLRLISDVPLGAFLSGGIDSSVVVALMCELGGHAGTVRTFSIGFDEPGFNELPYARAIAERYGTVHEEFVVHPHIGDVLPDLVWHYGEPFADSSAIPTYYLSRLTRNHVTVALNGDGGDENFAGYDRYAENPRNEAYGRLPAWLRAVVAGGAAALPVQPNSDAVARARRWARIQGMATARQAAVNRMLIDLDVKAELCTPEFLSAAGQDAGVSHVQEAYLSASAREPLDRLLSMDAETYLPGALLPKVDVATMAFGLEGRSPLLDHEVMELSARMPVGYKRRGTDGKILLKRLARKLVPSEVIDRPKRGFSVPLVGWFRAELADTLRETLLGARARTRGLIAHRPVERMVTQHLAGTHDWHEQLWILLMLELWCQTYLDARPWRPAARASRAGGVAVA